MRKLRRQSARKSFEPYDARLCPLVFGFDWFSGYPDDAVERLTAMYADWQDPSVKHLAWTRFNEAKAQGRASDLSEPWASENFSGRTLDQVLREHNDSLSE